MLSLVLSPPLPVGLEFGFGNTVNAPKYSLYNETVYNIINSRLSYYMLDNRLTNYIGAELMTGQKDPDDLSPDGIDNTKRSLKAGCRWKIKPDAILALEAENIDYQDNAVDPAEDEFSYTENRITVKFEIKF
jgi:hypothetical protein